MCVSLSVVAHLSGVRSALACDGFPDSLEDERGAEGGVEGPHAVDHAGGLPEPLHHPRVRLHLDLVLVALPLVGQIQDPPNGRRQR